MTWRTSLAFLLIYLVMPLITGALLLWLGFVLWRLM